MSPLGRFALASGATNLADGIALVAWAWLATLLTRDPLLIALVPVAVRLPWFLFAIPAGIVTDRVDRKRLILAMDALRAIGFLLAAAVIWAATPLPEPASRGLSNPSLFYMILIAALLIGSAEVFRDNATQTMLPAIVPPEELERANGRIWSAELIGNALLGPAALSNTRNWRAELAEGYRFLMDTPLLRALALITGFWNLLFEMAMIALVLHVQDNLGLGARAYGLILASGAVGGIAGGLAGEHVVRWLGPKRTAQIMLACSAPAFLAFAFAPNAVCLAVAMALFQFTGLVWNTVSVSYRQRTIPDAILGRVNSLYRLLAWGMMPVGLLLSGLIVRMAELSLPRETALTMPFHIATLGAMGLAVMGWRALNRWFIT